MRSERGSVTVGLAGATAIFLLLVLGFVSLIRLEMGQLRADLAAAAGATAAIRSLRGPVEAEVETETNRRLDAFWQEVTRAVDQAVSDWESQYAAARRRELEAQTSPLSPSEIDRIIASEIAAHRADVAEAYRWAEVYARKPAIAADLLAGRPLPLPVRLREFTSAPDRGCLLYRVAAAFESDMNSAARRLVERNGAELARPVRVTATNRLEVGAVARWRSRLLVWDQFLPESSRYLYMPGSAYLDNLAGHPLEFQGACRKE